jgi:hypothetical protein
MRIKHNWSITAVINKLLVHHVDTLSYQSNRSHIRDKFSADCLLSCGFATLNNVSRSDVGLPLHIGFLRLLRIPPAGSVRDSFTRGFVARLFTSSHALRGHRVASLARPRRLIARLTVDSDGDLNPTLHPSGSQSHAPKHCTAVTQSQLQMLT